ncbi:MAG: sulfatase-like hydrolase/transferase [Anaerolineaceae bacterium]|nr:sulfatase-like hydrolase/transferase [Anaerolineaceae bacterium]
MAKIFKQLVLHPFFFALFPILSLYVVNLGQVPFLEAARPLLIGLGGAALMLVVLRLVIGEWHRAGLAASLAVLLFFTFGHAHRVLISFFGPKHFASQSVWMIAVWLFFFFLGLRAIVRTRQRPKQLTFLLNMVGAAAIVTCLWWVGVYGIRGVKANMDATAAPPAEKTVEPHKIATYPPPVPPDIYWIVLDGYGRQDVLSELYQTDNRPFLRFLKTRGFYVANQAHSNYGQTALSLSSTLNMDYLDQLLALKPDWNDRAQLTELINNSLVQQALDKAGYQTIAFSNGYPVTQMVEADRFVQREGELSSFEVSLLSGSLGDGGAINQTLLDDYRKRIIWQAVELEILAKEPGPKFVFAHFILPHPPFVFPSSAQTRMSLAGADGSSYDGTTAEYIQGYRQQLNFTNHLAQDMITSILANSKRPPIIILQGDHGPGSHLDWSSAENTCMRERFSILNAYYFPEREYSALYPQITPVNSFRVVLNRYLGTNLPLLDDRSFYSTWERPYELQEVTDQLELRCK